MTIQFKRVLLTLVSGSALTLAPLAYATVVVPPISHADGCADGGDTCGPDAKGLNCPDGTIVDEQNKQCVDITSGISKQLMALPPPPSLAGGGGGLGSVGGWPAGIPSIGTVNMPDAVLPSLGLGLVPNLNVALQPQFGGVAAPAAAPPSIPSLASLPAPQLPPPPSINPPNPLGLPPPPDLTPGSPFS
ncbi:MAG TPA: hypothetical protein VET27_07275 [Mycobacterium sp.]|nr:hypothetical protein [Mycobacterium sp.]